MMIAHGLITRGDTGAAGNWALGVLFVLSVLTVGTIGSTPGKRLLGLRVISVDGQRLGLVRVVRADRAAVPRPSGPRVGPGRPRAPRPAVHAVQVRTH